MQRYKPDILLLGLVMPGMDGLQVIRKTRELSPLTRPVVFSGCKTEAQILRALENGAFGYVAKSDEPAEMVMAVREALANRWFLSSQISELNLTSMLRRATTGPHDLYQTLTEREREIMQLTVECHGSKGIGARLGISPRTVEAHRANLMRKLGLHRTADVVRYALERRLLSGLPHI